MAEKLTNAQESQAKRVAELNACIEQYDREFATWQKRADKVIKRYRDDGRQTNVGARFNILWSNVQTLTPATFSRLPKPDVSRRFRDNDPVGRVAALLLERALEYEVNHYPDYRASMGQCVLDRFLPGRGIAWARYEPHFKASMPDGVQVTEDSDEEEEQKEELEYECSPVDYVHWKDFGHSVARTWEEVTKVWRIVYLGESAVKERFGEEWAARIPYDASPEKKDKAKGGDGTQKQARIYEIWDKDTGKAVWLSKSLNEVIDELDDPLELEGFFPCPKPLYATTTNDTLIPVPDFVLYQDQADLLDVLMDRIEGLVKSLQVKGVHDAAIPELARLFTEGRNTDLIPVKNWAAFAEKNGLAGAVDLVDIAPFAVALKECYLAVQQIKEIIYEITGISDIVRGQSDSSETLGAQQIKQNFVGLRLRTMQNEVAQFAASLLSLKAQIICANYAPESILRIAAAEQLSEADKKYIKPAVALLIGPERMADPKAPPGPNPLRSFRIDVEADSLVQMDEQQEKQDRMEFLKATGTFLKEALPVVQAEPQAAPLLLAMLKFGVVAFKIGKTIEGDFDQAIDAMKQQSKQPQAQKPDPEMAKVQAQQAIAQAKMQGDAQSEQARAQTDMAIERQKMMMQAQFEQQRLQLETQAKAQQASIDAQLAKWEAVLKARTAVEVAEIGASATISAQQTAAARQATQE